ncbi:MAG: hypothetical protein JJ899_08410 [Alphaproteobacteria bacterium]|nr:hypothetical protein [Alphaproteobacteria bacterium]
MSVTETEKPDNATTFRIKESREMDPAEVETKHVARFNDLIEDDSIFKEDRDDEIGERRHFHVISPEGYLKDAKITSPHHFHISYVELPPGHEVQLHAHDVAEVFVQMTGTFEFGYGDQGQHKVVLNPMDTFSVPIDVMRGFKNVGLTNGIVMVIYDKPGDILENIFYDEEHIDEIRETWKKSGKDITVKRVN